MQWLVFETMSHPKTHLDAEAVRSQAKTLQVQWFGRFKEASKCIMSNLSPVTASR